MPIKAIVDGTEKEITRIPVLVNNVYKDTWEVRDNQDRLIWYREDTLTGTPSITYKGYGMPLKSMKIVGKGIQYVLPSPDRVILPTFCGVSTENLMPAGEKKTITNNGITFESDGFGRYHVYGTSTDVVSAKFFLISGFTAPISISNGGQGTLSLFNNQSTSSIQVIFCRGETDVDDWKLVPNNRTNTAYKTLGNKYIDSIKIKVLSGTTVDMTFSPEFTDNGVLPTEFEPYGWKNGWKISVTNAGQTIPIYLGEVPTIRRVKKLVLTGEESWRKSSKYTGSFYVYLSAIAPDAELYSRIVCTHAYNQPGTYQYGCGQIDDNSLSLWLFDSDVSLDTFKAYLADQYASGTPVTVWYATAEPETTIVNEPLAKIGSYTDELIIDPNITPQTGTNTLTVDTTLSPSSVSITGHIKAIDQ